MGVNGQRHPRPHFSPGERTPGNHCTGGWVGPRAGLDTEARRKILSPLPGIEPWSPGGPARSQTLHWLSYPAHRRWVFKGDRIRSMTSFGGEVKPSTPRRKILHVKEPYNYEKRYFVGKVHGHFSPSLFCFATRYVWCLLPERSGG
jgi:hypothetical protein